MINWNLQKKKKKRTINTHLHQFCLSYSPHITLISQFLSFSMSFLTCSSFCLPFLGFSFPSIFGQGQSTSGITTTTPSVEMQFSTSITPESLSISSTPSLGTNRQPAIHDLAKIVHLNLSPTALYVPRSGHYVAWQEKTSKLKN